MRQALSTTLEKKAPLEILLVEDNPGDVRLTHEVFKECGIQNHLSVVNDGEQALHRLKREGEYHDVRLPDIILLDLNLPKKDGRAVLAEIKADTALRRIPVVILTTSRDREDIDHAYDLHANCYILKPVDLNQFMSVMRQLETFWLEIVRLPSL